MINFFSRIIPQKDSELLSFEENPWAGLSSYEDPDKSNRPLVFCGRDNESYDVSQLIDDNILVTLYGKSGTGKTSLLNAGVFPRLRSAHYLPISIRLSMDSIGKSFQSCIRIKLKQTIEENHFHEELFEVIPLPKEEQSEEYLWSYFARARFSDTDGNCIFPVLVFDQFEEVFRDRKQEAEALLRQIYYMMDESHALTNRMVGDSVYTYDFNFRFVLSIREDDLFCLEDSIDNNYLIAMKHCRYRLRSLSEEGARDAILVPGHGLFEKSDEDKIVEAIIQTSRNVENGGISTNLLSLICSRLYIYCKKSGKHLISAHLVNNYIAGNPFEKYYNEATVGLSNKEKAYIEEHLVDSAGRRNSISETDFLLHVKGGGKLLEGSQKILQRISTSSSSKGNRIELIHDSFCEPLSEFKQKRLLRRRRKVAFVSLSLALLSIGIAIMIRYQLYNVKRLNYDMQVNNARYVSEKANDLTSEGDSYTARLLALYVLDNRPYVHEAEAALRNASYHNSAILREHQASVISVNFSKDGKHIISQSTDSTKIIWDAINGSVIEKKKVPIIKGNPFGKSIDGTVYAQQTSDETIFEVRYTKNGQLLNSFDGHEGEVKAVCFSPDKRLIASASTDNTIVLWNISGEKVTTLKGHTNHVACIAFSPDGNRLVSGADDNTVRIWDMHGVNRDIVPLNIGSPEIMWMSCVSPSGKIFSSVSDFESICIGNLRNGGRLHTIIGQTGIKSMALSPDDRRIICGYNNGEIRALDIETESPINSWQGHKSNVNVIAISPDGRYVASSSSVKNDSIKLWDSKSFKLLNTFYGHTDKVNYIVFDKTAKFFASVSNDKTIKIWDCKSGECLRTIVGHKDAVSYAAFSASGQKLVSTSSDNTIRIWDVLSGTQLSLFEGHTDETKAVSFYNADSLIVSATNNQIMVWDISSGVVLSKMEGRSRTLSSLFINPQDNRICTTYIDGVCEKWSFPSLSELMDEAKSRFREINLSSEQMNKYYIE